MDMEGRVGLEVEEGVELVSFEISYVWSIILS